MSLTASRRSRRALAVITIAWIVVMLYLGLASRLPVVGDVDASTWSSWGHAVGTMILAALLYLLIVGTGGRTRAQTAVVVLVLATLFAIALEGLQALGGERDPSFVDVGLDTAGAFVAVALLSRPRFSIRAWSNAVMTTTVVLLALIVPAVVLATPEDDTNHCDIDGLPLAESGQPAPGGPVPRPIALYRFDEGAGRRVADVSGVAPPLDLRVSGSGVGWHAGGGLRFDGGVARSEEPPRKIVRAATRSGEITIEAWVRTGDVDQAGPTRIVSISSGTEPDQINIHLGQERRALSVRLRATCDDFNWTTVSDVFTPTRGAVHVAVTFVKGAERIYVEGENLGAWHLDGRLGAWDAAFPLVVGNEATLDRPFDGAVYEVSIYDTALAGSVIASRARTPPPGA